MPETASTFDSWAIVEVFGHQRYAGRVTEQTIGGSSFVRIDVPETAGQKPFTKLFGQGSIFSISPVEEAVARSAAEHCFSSPVQPYELPDDIQRAAEHMRRQKALPLMDGKDADNEDDIVF